MSLTPRSLARLKGTGTRAMSSGSTQRIFQLKLDPLTGNSEWVVIDEQDQEEQLPEYSQKPLLATTSYLDMLNDSPRNTALRQAIDKTVSKPCHVLDIGYVLPFSHWPKPLSLSLSLSLNIYIYIYICVCVCVCVCVLWL
jgi:protein arginine N-methyltransferase 7